jgi:two-component system, NarL family, sensor histidine kinase UhpB
MKSKLLFFFTSLISVSGMAQKADSLEVVIKKTRTDSTLTILYSVLADEYNKSNATKGFQSARKGLALSKKIDFRKGMFENNFSIASIHQGQAQFDSAIFYLRIANSTAETLNDIRGQAEVCSSLGHSFMRKSNMDSARHYLDRGLTLAKKINDFRIEAGIYNNYGNVLLEESNYQLALDYFIKAARLYENPLKDEHGQGLALSNIGNIEYRLGNYDQALDYAHQSMAIAKKRKLNSSIGYAHKLLGRIYRKQKKYDSALIEYKQGQELYVSLGDTRSAAEILQNIGNIYFDKGKHRDALANYLESLRLSKKISNKSLIAYAYSSIGQAFMALAKNDDALIYLDSSRRAAQAISNKYLVLDNLDAMSSVHESKGDYKKALSIHQQFMQLKDSVTRSENRQLAEETQAKYELEKKEAQIALLEKDHELKDISLGRQRAIQAGTAIALISVIIIAALLVNRYRLSHRSKRQADIERVRNTIARDLHDDIGSTLSTINIISKLAIHDNPGGKNIHLIRIAEQSSLIMESMSDMVWSINPVNDSLEKVVVRMKVFASEILEPRNINYQFSGEESLNGLALDPEKRKNLFLIFKEALNNTAKYSDANDVQIFFGLVRGKVTLIVTDDGKGFDRQYAKTGNGLKNMQTRAQSMGAHFDLTSAAGKGTKIIMELPVT